MGQFLSHCDMHFKDRSYQRLRKDPREKRKESEEERERETEKENKRVVNDRGKRGAWIPDSVPQQSLNRLQRLKLFH